MGLQEVATMCLQWRRRHHRAVAWSFRSSSQETAQLPRHLGNRHVVVQIVSQRYCLRLCRFNPCNTGVAHEVRVAEGQWIADGTSSIDQGRKSCSEGPPRRSHPR